MDNQEKYAPSSEQTLDSSKYTEPTATSVETQAKSNQRTTALIAVIVVLLVIMLLLSMNGKLFTPNNTANISAAASQNQALRANLNAERARQGLPPLPDDSQNALIISERIQRDATSLVSLSKQWETELSGKDAIISDLQLKIKQRDDVATSLYRQIADLQSKLDKEGSSSAQLVQISNELQLANSQIETYRQQLAELQSRPTAETVATLRQQLATNMEERNKLQLQIDGLLANAQNQVDSSKVTELEAELAKIRPEYNSQRYEIQRLRALLNRDRLFIESESDLPAEAARLFAKLRSLEDANEQQLLAAYQSIGTSMNAEVVHRQEFAVGSSQITFDRETIIQDILDKRSDNASYFLVVGYASKSGGADNNRKLSANRATTVASVVDTLKASNQNVQAVYLGETARFSANDESANQICEVWEIKR